MLGLAVAGAGVTCAITLPLLVLTLPPAIPGCLCWPVARLVKACGGLLTDTRMGLAGLFFSLHESQLATSGSVLSPLVSNC